MKRKTPALVGLLAVVLSAGPACAAEPVAVSVSKIKDLSLRVYGFVEADFIHDTTQPSFNEEQGNKLVPMRTAAGGGANSFAGQRRRTEMSARNSRLGFDLALPRTEAGLESEGVIELDFMGNNGADNAPGTPTAGPAVQTERDYFNNPAVRVRHAYLSLTYNGWNGKAGQYWSLLGWQPYYFPGEAIVQPGPGQLYRRFAQFRVTNTRHIQDAWTFESAADVAKPAEINSGNPELHGGLRVASTKYKGASIGGAGTSMVGLSAAVSGAVIPLQTNGIGNPTGQAVAFDVAVPIIPSADGKDRSGNLTWMGEFMSGNGVGGLEYSGLDLGVPGVSAAAANAGTAIDKGIAGLNQDGNAEPLRARAFRTHLQYSLGTKWAFSTGYAQVEGRNLDRFGTKANAFGASLAPKIQFGYASLFYDPLAWVRVGAEWNQTRDTYNDAANRFATNNRFQLSTFFIF